MKLAIILTTDWELFGDGSGDYFIHQKEPLSFIIQVLEHYGARMTVFAEVIQQLNMLKRAPQNNYYRRVSLDWERTIGELVRHDHDVQLHIHPQLIERKEEEEKFWSIAEMPDEKMYEILRDSKAYLEKTVRKVDENYKCIAFRAGGYAIQPSGGVLKNLIKAGIKCDSSVTKGLKGSFFDFRHAYSHFFPWFTRSDVCKKEEQENSLLEIPIFSIPRMDSPLLRRLFPVLYYKLFFLSRITQTDKNWIKLPEKGKRYYSVKNKYSSQMKRAGIKFLLSKVLQRTSLQFDYDKFPAGILADQLKTIWSEINEVLKHDKTISDNIYLPVVFIGHTKELKSTYNLEKLLRLISEGFQDGFEFFTISGYYHDYLKQSGDFEKAISTLIKEKVFK